MCIVLQNLENLFKELCVEMTELLAHLDSWLQPSRCVMQGDSYVVDSRTM